MRDELRAIIQAVLDEHGLGYGANGYDYSIEVGALVDGVAPMVERLREGIEAARERLADGWAEDAPFAPFEVIDWLDALLAAFREDQP